MTTMATVTAKSGIRFTVRILRTGDRYGLDDCLTVGEGSSLRIEGPGPFVEFFDTRYPHTEHGQFVSRYGVDTILAATGGLDLLTHVADWKVDAPAMDVIRQWLRHEEETASC